MRAVIAGSKLRARPAAPARAVVDGWRISDVLALRPRDVRRDSLVLPNRTNPNQTTKRVFLPGAELGLTGELPLWAKEQGVGDDEVLFFSRKRGPDGWRRALQRGQA